MPQVWSSESTLAKRAYRAVGPSGSGASKTVSQIWSSSSHMRSTLRRPNRAALSLLATVRQELGSLDRVDRFLHVYAVVNATPAFVDHTAVIDAASDVFVQVFGERGEHARLAVGVASLPMHLALEVQATIAVYPPAP